jgi:hypothetical protein
MYMWYAYYIHTCNDKVRLRKQYVHLCYVHVCMCIHRCRCAYTNCKISRNRHHVHKKGQKNKLVSNTFVPLSFLLHTTNSCFSFLVISCTLLSEHSCMCLFFYFSTFPGHRFFQTYNKLSHSTNMLFHTIHSL